MMETTTEKSVRLPTFDGDRKKFQLWWTRFGAYATVYKFDQALRIDEDEDMPDAQDTEIDTTTSQGKKMEAAKKRNALAMSMAFTSDGSM